MEDINILDYYPKGLFWDVHADRLHWKDDAWYIVDRVLSRSEAYPENLDKLESIYPLKGIKQVALESASIFGQEYITELSKRYNLDKTKFKNWIIY